MLDIQDYGTEISSTVNMPMDMNTHFVRQILRGKAQYTKPLSPRSDVVVLRRVWRVTGNKLFEGNREDMEGVIPWTGQTSPLPDSLICLQ